MPPPPHQLLASTGCGESTARHIVIVAASTPVEDSLPEIGDDVSLNARSGWHLLAQKLTRVLLSQIVLTFFFFLMIRSYPLGRNTLPHDPQPKPEYERLYQIVL